MRVFEEPIQKGSSGKFRVLLELSFKEGRLLFEMCECAAKANPRKISYKTLLSKLDEMPVWTIDILGARAKKEKNLENGKRDKA